MTTANDDPFDFLNNNPPGRGSGRSDDVVQALLSEIVRVRELIKYYDAIPDGAGKLGSAILGELVEEAYTSLVNYDVVLMQKYLDLLLNCD